MENPFLDRGSAFCPHITLFKLFVISSLEQGLTLLMYFCGSGTVRGTAVITICVNVNCSKEDVQRDFSIYYNPVSKHPMSSVC